jgi:hypothetical protein
MTTARPNPEAGSPAVLPEPRELATTARALWDSAQWSRCLALLGDAASRAPLPKELVELRCQLAYLVGREEEGLVLSFDAFRRFEAEGEGGVLGPPSSCLTGEMPRRVPPGGHGPGRWSTPISSGGINTAPVCVLQAGRRPARGRGEVGPPGRLT